MTGPPEREHVSVSEELLRDARQRYPPEGSPDGTPRLEHFELGPLAAAVAYFEREFDRALEAAAGVRFYTTGRYVLSGDGVLRRQGGRRNRSVVLHRGR